MKNGAVGVLFQLWRLKVQGSNLGESLCSVAVGFCCLCANAVAVVAVIFSFSIFMRITCKGLLKCGRDVK